MRGEGWECDNCNTKAVTAKKYGYPTMEEELPENWCAFIYRDNREYTGMQMRHLCSIKCLEEYAYVLRNQILND